MAPDTNLGLIAVCEPRFASGYMSKTLLAPITTFAAPVSLKPTDKSVIIFAPHVGCSISTGHTKLHLHQLF